MKPAMIALSAASFLCAAALVVVSILCMVKPTRPTRSFAKNIEE